MSDEEDWCDVCDKPIKRGGLVNYKTGLRCHMKCGRKIGAYNEPPKQRNKKEEDKE